MQKQMEDQQKQMMAQSGGCHHNRCTCHQGPQGQPPQANAGVQHEREIRMHLLFSNLVQFLYMAPDDS